MNPSWVPNWTLANRDYDLQSGPILSTRCSSISRAVIITR